MTPVPDRYEEAARKALPPAHVWRCRACTRIWEDDPGCDRDWHSVRDADYDSPDARQRCEGTIDALIPEPAVARAIEKAVEEARKETKRFAIEVEASGPYQIKQTRTLHPQSLHFSWVVVLGSERIVPQHFGLAYWAQLKADELNRAWAVGYQAALLATDQEEEPPVISERHVQEEMQNIRKNQPVFPGDTISHATAEECVRRGWAKRDAHGDFVAVSESDGEGGGDGKRSDRS